MRLNKYYVYQYLREDGTPYYIGKGSGSRIHDKNHKVKLPPKERRQIIEKNLDEETAYWLESCYIYKHGMIHMMNGGILENRAYLRYSADEIKEAVEFEEEYRKKEEEDKERFKEYYQELEDNWQKELYDLREVRDNDPERFTGFVIDYEYFDENEQEQLKEVCKELLV